jgi:hypothetical protein
VVVVMSVIAVSATSQTQQRVQTTTQLTVAKPVIADPLSEWETRYAEAMKVAAELKESGSPEHGERLENDLRGLDQALREYVRVSERLRHKNRALDDTMQFLALQNAVQMESRRYQTLSNASKAAQDAENNTIRNTRQ